MVPTTCPLSIAFPRFYVIFRWSPQKCDIRIYCTCYSEKHLYSLFTVNTHLLLCGHLWIFDSADKRSVKQVRPVCASEHLHSACCRFCSVDFHLRDSFCRMNCICKVRDGHTCVCCIGSSSNCVCDLSNTVRPVLACASP
jgi:hypothetical protein